MSDGFVFRVKPMCTYPSLGSLRFRQISLIQILHGLLSIWITQIVCLKGKTRAALRYDLPWFLTWLQGRKKETSVLDSYSPCSVLGVNDWWGGASTLYLTLYSEFQEYCSSQWRLPSFDQIYSQISTQGKIYLNLAQAIPYGS